MSAEAPSPSTPWPLSLTLAGAGRMGGAMLSGWLAGGLDPARVRIVDPHPSPEMLALCAERGIVVGAPPGPAQVLVLAVKPQTFAADPSPFARLAFEGTLVVSILAGRTLAGLRAALPSARAIVRAMPNLAAAVGRGASGVAAEEGSSAEDRALAERLLATSGHVEWLDEPLIDAVTAVSGSGPAYVFLLAECLARAGVEAGLPAGAAARLARATVEGAGELMRVEAGRSPAQLREAVTSPGGTTAAALQVLLGDDGLQPLLTRAVAAAARRAGELAG